MREREKIMLVGIGELEGRSLERNKVGIEGERENAGRSRIVSPVGEEIMVTGSPDHYEVIHAKIDLDRCKKCAENDSILERPTN